MPSGPNYPSVPPEVASRIRRPAPADHCIVLESLPVVSFGDPNQAKVATLSLNPSHIEFKQNGRWLLGPEKRLESLKSLGVSDPRNLTDVQVAQVVAACNNYFKNNPYRRWFGFLERLMEASQAGSYYDGSVCHLDLVQWATDPVQSRLPRRVWQSLVDQDSPFLRWQLENSTVRVVLLNGQGVVKWIHASGLVTNYTRAAINYKRSNGKNGVINVYQAASGPVLFLGWHKVLAQPLSQDGRDRLANWICSHLNTRTEATSVHLVNGYLPGGLMIHSKKDLAVLLEKWVSGSQQLTIGDIGTYGGRALIRVVIPGKPEVVLNADTKRAAVKDYLDAVKHYGRDLTWRVVANKKGKFNRITYRPDGAPTPGFYAYTANPCNGPLEI